MKRTKIVPVNRIQLFPAVTELEEQGLEITDFKPILENLKTMRRRDIGYCLGKTEASINGRVKLLRAKGVIEKWNGKN